MTTENDGNLFALPENETKSDPFLTYTDSLRFNRVPIIIDNGSYQCKAGWACNDSPSLVFRNHIAKHRGKRENETEIGNDIQNIEVVRWLLKTQFDRNVVVQLDVQEVIFDYLFSHMGINTDGSVDHPIVITEALCNPNYSRQLMNELLFECYQVPSVAHGIDALFAFHYNRGVPNGDNGLILSLGHHTSHIIPILSKEIDIQSCRRLNVGGQHMISFLHRLLQLKYPPHSSSVSISRSESFIHQHMHFSTNYSEDIDKWENESYYKNYVHRIQLPFTPVLTSASATGAGKFEKCDAILHQVQAVKIKRRTEKLTYYEERLQELLSVQELLEDDDDEAILALQELGYSTASELQAGIKELNCKIKKIKSIIALQHADQLQESPFKGWSDELDLNMFPDVDLWIESVRAKRDELKENPIQSSFGIKNTDLSGFSFSRALDMIGGLHEICGTDQTYAEYISKKEERREHLEILDEIIAEYDMEFSNSEPSYLYNTADFYQLHLGVETIRIPEIIFQPNILGIEQAGLAETLEMILSKYDSYQQQKLVENVLITGGCASIPMVYDRVHAELLAMRPFQSKFKVHLSKNPRLDAWKGAKLWSVSQDNLMSNSISKREYEEKGGDYLKEHPFSNIYFPTPQSSRKSSVVASDAGCSLRQDDKNMT